MKTKREIVERDTNTLFPYATNPRTHNDYQIKQLMDSIKEFGFTNPILIDSNDTIIAGHGRVQAAIALNIKKVPCIVLDNLTPEQLKAYVIADNRLAENAGWDQELLAQEIFDLQKTNIDISLLGFTDAELELINRGWSVESEKIDSIEGTDDIAESVIKIRCSQSQKDTLIDFLKEILKKSEFNGVSIG